MSDDQLSIALEEFEQLDSLDSRGVGLGLAIVKKSADLSRHELSVNSNNGRGTVFSLLLERAEKPRNESGLSEQYQNRR